jgi:hypothetical protein
MHSDSARFSQTIIHSAVCKGLNGKVLDPSISYGRKKYVEISEPLQFLLFNELKQVGVDHVGIGGAHAVREFFIDLQCAVLQQFHRQ